QLGLLDRAQRPEFDRRNRAEQAELRELHGRKRAKPMLPLAEANARRPGITWRREDVAVPAFTGPRAVEVPLAELVPYIDWTFFFTAWELKGRFPAILDHPQ